jgi:RNA polymerase sigma-70 factor (ECF subfamily)
MREEGHRSELSVALVQKLFVQNTPALRGFVVSLLADFSLVDDVVQETFLTAVRKADEFKPGTNFTSWVCSIARFKILEARRRATTQPLSEEVIDSLCASAPEPAPSWRLPLLARCLEELSPQVRRMVELRYQEAQKPADIARCVGWTPEAVYVALSRARMLLRQCVERRAAKESEA